MVCRSMRLFAAAMLVSLGTVSCGEDKKEDESGNSCPSAAESSATSGLSLDGGTEIDPAACPGVVGTTVQPDAGNGSGTVNPVPSSTSCGALQKLNSAGGCVAMSPGDAKDAGVCHQLSGFWYANNCHAAGISCVNNDFKPDAAKESCIPKLITDWTTLADCQTKGGFWYDVADVTKTDAAGFAALNPTCRAERTTSCPGSGNLIYSRKNDNSTFNANVLSFSISKSWQDVAELYSTLRCFNNLTTLSVMSGTLTRVDAYLMPGLTSLSVSGNALTEINLKRNTALQSLNISGNPFAGQVDLSANTAISDLHLSNVGSYNVGAIAFGNFPGLHTLDISNNNLTTLNQAALPVSILTLDISGGSLATLNIGHLTNLQYLSNSANLMTSVDLKPFSNLVSYYGYGNFNLTSIDTFGLTNLQWLSSYSCGLTSIDVLSNLNLDLLEIDGNNISSVDLSGNPFLRTLWLAGNPLTSLDLTSNGIIETLYLYDIPVTGVLDLSAQTLLQRIDTNRSGWSSINLTSSEFLNEAHLFEMPNFALDFDNFHPDFIGKTEGDNQTGIYISAVKWAAATGTAPTWPNATPYYDTSIRYYPNLAP